MLVSKVHLKQWVDDFHPPNVVDVVQIGTTLGLNLSRFYLFID